MANVLVVGAQWGDEGKGKVVDLLTEFADVVVRYQGGANAGHTLVVNGATTILHHIPSGVLHPGKLSVLGNGMVVNPAELVQEIEALRGRGFLQQSGELWVSSRAHVILPYHTALDGAREDHAAAGAGKIGTTRRGIGPAYEDKVGRRGVRMCDLLDPERFDELVERHLPEKNALLQHHGAKPIALRDFRDSYRAAADALRPFVVDTSRLLAREVSRGRSLLFEGAQGTLLDVDHGTYPYVTSSTTVAAGAASGAGLGPGVVDRIVGISKAYTTRVGEGPFPTEDTGELGETLRREGKEFGATTGRPRRCGWLDVAGLRAARRLNGLDGLALTKLDVLGGHKRLRICIGYKRGSERTDELPDDLSQSGGWSPEYEELEGWPESVREVREMDDLPRTARRYIARVEDLTGLPVLLVSVGAARGETIVRRNPFRD